MALIIVVRHVHVDSSAQFPVLRGIFGFPSEWRLVVPKEGRAAERIFLKKSRVMGQNIGPKQAAVGMTHKPAITWNGSVARIDEWDKLLAKEAQKERRAARSRADASHGLGRLCRVIAGSALLVGPRPKAIFI